MGTTLKWGTEMKLRLEAIGYSTPLTQSDITPGTNGAMLIDIIRKEYLRQGTTECSDLRLSMKEHGQFIKGVAAARVIDAARLYALLEKSEYVVIKIQTYTETER